MIKSQNGDFFCAMTAIWIKIAAKKRKKYRIFLKKVLDKSKWVCYYIQALSEATVEWF